MSAGEHAPDDSGGERPVQRRIDCTWLDAERDGSVVLAGTESELEWILVDEEDTEAIRE